MQNRFPETLIALREKAQLTNRELAKRAQIPESLISGLQLGNRRIGEANARQIGEALSLTGNALEAFVLEAINTSTRKLLQAAVGYPAALLNLTAGQLLQAGVTPDHIREYAINEEGQTFTLLLTDGRKVTMNSTLTLN